MSDGFGIEKPVAHQTPVHRLPARYLILIDAGGSTLARLVLASYEAVAEFDAGSEEVALMTRGLQSVKGAGGAEWNRGPQRRRAR